MSEWLDLEVDAEDEQAEPRMSKGGGGSGSGSGAADTGGGGSGGGSFSSAPLRHLAKVSHRNEAAIASIMATMESLRTLAHATTANTPPTDAPSLSSLNQSLAAYVTRLKVQTRMASSRESILRGAPASSAEQVLQTIQTLEQETHAFETSFPKHVRQVSAHTLSLTRNELLKAREVVSEMANKAAVARQRYENELQQTTSGLVAEAKARMLRAKGDLLRSRLIQELISDAGRVLEMLGSNVEMGDGETGDSDSQLAYAAESMISHLSTLHKVATIPQDVQREVECVRLAFGEFVNTLRNMAKGRSSNSTGFSSSGPSSSLTSGSSSTSIPRRLLVQVTNPQRRMELSTMEPSKASSLLQHTREALTEMDPGSVQYKKLKVVEEILVYRAAAAGGANVRGGVGAGGGTGAGSGSSMVPLMAEKWQLQKTAVDAEFRRLMREVEIARGAEEKVIAAREKAMRTATAELHRAASTHMHRVNAVVEEKLGAWRKDMDRVYREGADKVLAGGQELVSRVIAALEVFVSTGLGKGGSSQRRHKHKHASSRHQHQRHHLSETSAFDFDGGEEGVNGHEVQDGGGGGDDEDEDDDGDELSSLLRRLYELTLEVFGAWEKVVEMVLRVNRYGMSRATDKVMATLDPIRTQFEALVKSCGGNVTSQAAT